MKIIGQQLVELANESDLVKSYLGIPKDWKNITKITHNAVHRYLGDGRYQGRFVSNRKYKGMLTTNQYIRLIEDGAFEHCYKSLERKYGQKVWDDYYNYQSVKGLSKKDFKAFAFADASFEPAAGANSPVDGVAYRGTWGTWDDLQKSVGTGASATDTGATSYPIMLYSYSTSNQWSTISRAIYLFDTSTIGDEVIESAVFKIYVTYKENYFTSSVGLVSSNPADNDNLVATDYHYSNWGTTRYASDLTISGMTTGQYNSFTLNSSGISAISTDGITKFGLRLDHDIDDEAPTWALCKHSLIRAYFADYGSNEPTLEVNWSKTWAGGTINTVDSGSMDSLDSVSSANILTINSVE